MSVPIALLLVVVGLVALTIGAEALVRGAAGLAGRLGISPLVVGLTVVAFGTSSPELAVSVLAASRGEPDIAVGNVIGSNIFNVFVILGLSAIVAPLIVQARLVRIDVPMVIAVSLAAWAFAADGIIGRIEAGLLFLGLIAYVAWTVRSARRERIKEPENGVGASRLDAMWLQIVFIIAGLGLCVAGSRWFVDGSVSLARALGVGELVIGLTIVAAGTSLPELATSAMAAARGHRDIAVGNVLGSNLFNILGVLGLSGLIAPPEVAAQAVRVDLPVMLFAALACVPVFISGLRISRGEGVMFLVLYGAYTAWLVLAGLGSPHARVVGLVGIVALALPLTAVMVVGAVLRKTRAEPGAPPACGS
jgi:cation:H+ antiporter